MLQVWCFLFGPSRSSAWTISEASTARRSGMNLRDVPARSFLRPSDSPSRSGVRIARSPSSIQRKSGAPTPDIVLLRRDGGHAATPKHVSAFWRSTSHEPLFLVSPPAPGLAANAAEAPGVRETSAMRLVLEPSDNPLRVPGVQRPALQEAPGPQGRRASLPQSPERSTGAASRSSECGPGSDRRGDVKTVQAKRPSNALEGSCIMDTVALLLWIAVISILITRCVFPKR